MLGSVSAVTNTLASDADLLWTSSRVFSERLDGHWVLFAPDRRGLPVVVSDPVMALLDTARSGATVGQLQRAAAHACSDIEPGAGQSLLTFLTERSFLRTKSDPLRYEARNPSEANQTSFSVWLHINNHCNLDCAYCFVDKSQVEMSEAVMDRTIAALRQTIITRHIKDFTLKFAGGEPTLSVPLMERFRDKLETALEGVPCSWFTSVLSNGTVMSDRLIAFLKRPKTGISISIDGYGTAGHDIYRVFKNGRRGSWDIVQSNITKALDNGIVPYILATVSEQTATTLPDLVRWIFRQGLKARIGVVRQPESTEAYSTFRLTATRRTVDDEYRQLIDAMNSAFENAFRELEEESYVLDLRSALSICELHFETPSFGSCCGIGSNHIVVNEAGELASCPMTVHRDTVPMADDILRAVPLTFAKYSPSDREKIEGKNCLDCQWFPVCVSGCPINNLAVNGRPYSVSPLHPFYEFVIPRYIQFFGRKLIQSARRRAIDRFLVLAA